ncbi:hypothetical protein [Aureivirga marina]|uniref:hypothetical protein n=1 Tax=Aureivirga marina TaxID=1182451 RepID=UPI0018C99B73|nr:hypothetical protein [Aureivirga marina]
MEIWDIYQFIEYFKVKTQKTLEIIEGINSEKLDQNKEEEYQLILKSHYYILDKNIVQLVEILKLFKSVELEYVSENYKNSTESLSEIYSISERVFSEFEDNDLSKSFKVNDEKMLLWKYFRVLIEEEIKLHAKLEYINKKKQSIVLELS